MRADGHDSQVRSGGSMNKPPTRSQVDAAMRFYAEGAPTPPAPIEHRDDAIAFAIEFAGRHQVCAARAAAAADAWFSALREPAQCGLDALERHLTEWLGIDADTVRSARTHARARP